MYAIIILFFLPGGPHGEGILTDRYDTLAQCEQAKPAQVEQFKAAVMEHHQITIVSSYCGLPSVGATDL